MRPAELRKWIKSRRSEQVQNYGCAASNLSTGKIARTIIGAVLIVAGIVVLWWGSKGFETTEKAINIGPLRAEKHSTHYVPNAPVAGVVIVASGLVMLAAGRT